MPQGIRSSPRVRDLRQQRLASPGAVRRQRHSSSGRLQVPPGGTGTGRGQGRAPGALRVLPTGELPSRCCLWGSEKSRVRGRFCGWSCLVSSMRER